jgi:hypothetical protein
VIDNQSSDNLYDMINNESSGSRDREWIPFDFPRAVRIHGQLLDDDRLNGDGRKLVVDVTPFAQIWRELFPEFQGRGKRTTIKNLISWKFDRRKKSESRSTTWK